MPGLFVTATGTDIGKTYVAAGLLRAGRRAGVSVDAFKPVLSGYDAVAAATSDAGVLLAALGRPINPETVAAMSPWRFAAPLSPDMAAAAEGRAIDVNAVTRACRAAAASNALTLIEGVGGVMVPLDARHTVLDLMATLGLPVVLIAGTYLGAISHCLTSVAALAANGIAPALIILNETIGSTVPTGATAQTLGHFTGNIPFAMIPQGARDELFDDLLTQVRAIRPSRVPGSAA